MYRSKSQTGLTSRDDLTVDKGSISGLTVQKIRSPFHEGEVPGRVEDLRNHPKSTPTTRLMTRVVWGCLPQNGVFPSHPEVLYGPTGLSSPRGFEAVSQGRNPPT